MRKVLARFQYVGNASLLSSSHLWLNRDAKDEEDGSRDALVPCIERREKHDIESSGRVAVRFIQRYFR